MRYFETIVRLSPQEAREAIDGVLNAERFRVEWSSPTRGYATSSSVARTLLFGWFSRLQVTVTIQPVTDGLTSIRVDKERPPWLALLDPKAAWNRQYVFGALQVAAFHALETAGVIARRSSG